MVLKLEDLNWQIKRQLITKIVTIANQRILIKIATSSTRRRVEKSLTNVENNYNVENAEASK